MIGDLSKYMVTRICTDCGHVFGGSVKFCRVSQVVRVFWSTGTRETSYRLCDEVNERGRCGKFIKRVPIMPRMIKWWQNWWDNYYKKKEGRPQ